MLISGRQKIRRKHVKLDAYPEHQRYAENSAQKCAEALFGQREVQPLSDSSDRLPQEAPIPKRSGRGIGHRQRAASKIRKHRSHPCGLPEGIQQHHERAANRTQADKQRPKNQDASCDPIARSHTHFLSRLSSTALYCASSSYTSCCSLIISLNCRPSFSAALRQRIMRCIKISK